MSAVSKSRTVVASTSVTGKGDKGCKDGTCSTNAKKFELRAGEAFCIIERIRSPLGGFWTLTEVIGNFLNVMFGSLLFYLGSSCARNIEYIDNLLVVVIGLISDDATIANDLMHLSWAFTYLFLFYGLFLINSSVIFVTKLLGHVIEND